MEQSEKKIRAVIKMRCFAYRAQSIVKRRVKGMAMEIGSTSSLFGFRASNIRC